ncbi:hypothetical protein EJ05DRAFT_477753, partial [Pseudovirgaria hyperparasitica]
MQIAEILSDLTSLRACDHAAAMALVSARPPSESSGQVVSSGQDQTAAASEADPDIARARDLVELHRAVKVAHRQGTLEMELEQARESVRKAVAGL